MSEEELAALEKLIRQRQRCMADDRQALTKAEAEVRRFAQAIDLDRAEIDEARRKISAHWTAKFEPAEAAS